MVKLGVVLSGGKATDGVPQGKLVPGSGSDWMAGEARLIELANVMNLQGSEGEKKVQVQIILAVDFLRTVQNRHPTSFPSSS